MQPHALIKTLSIRPAGFIQRKNPMTLSLSIFVSEAADSVARVCDIFSKYQVPNVNSNHMVDLWVFIKTS